MELLLAEVLLEDESLEAELEVPVVLVSLVVVVESESEVLVALELLAVEVTLMPGAHEVGPVPEYLKVGLKSLYLFESCSVVGAELSMTRMPYEPEPTLLMVTLVSPLASAARWLASSTQRRAQLRAKQ